MSHLPPSPPPPKKKKVVRNCYAIAAVIGGVVRAKRDLWNITLHLVIVYRKNNVNETKKVLMLKKERNKKGFNVKLGWFKSRCQRSVRSRVWCREELIAFYSRGNLGRLSVIYNRQSLYHCRSGQRTVWKSISGPCRGCGVLLPLTGQHHSHPVMVAWVTKAFFCPYVCNAVARGQCVLNELTE